MSVSQSIAAFVAQSDVISYKTGSTLSETYAPIPAVQQNNSYRKDENRNMTSNERCRTNMLWY